MLRPGEVALGALRSSDGGGDNGVCLAAGPAVGRRLRRTMTSSQVGHVR